MQSNSEGNQKKGTWNELQYKQKLLRFITSFIVVFFYFIIVYYMYVSYTHNHPAHNHPSSIDSHFGRAHRQCKRHRRYCLKFKFKIKIYFISFTSLYFVFSPFFNFFILFYFIYFCCTIFVWIWLFTYAYILI